jgi:hypothetical protein
MCIPMGKKQHCGRQVLRHTAVLVACCLVPILSLALNTRTALGRGPAMSYRERQAAMISRQLTSKGAKGYHGREVHPAQRWYVLLLRDRKLEVSHPLPGLEQWTEGRTVSYVKVQGLEQAVTTVMSYLETTPSGHVRDFDARYYVLVSRADAQLAELASAAEAVGARPVLSVSSIAE